MTETLECDRYQCVDGTVEMRFCIDAEVAEAFRSACADSHRPDEEGFTETEVVSDSLNSFLFSLGLHPRYPGEVRP